MWRWTAVLHDVWLRSVANCRWRPQHSLWLAVNWHDRRLVDLLCADQTWRTETGTWCIHTNTASSHMHVLFSCSLWDKVLATSAAEDSYGMWHCITGYTVTDIPQDHTTSSFGVWNGTPNDTVPHPTQTKPSAPQLFAAMHLNNHSSSALPVTKNFFILCS